MSEIIESNNTDGNKRHYKSNGRFAPKNGGGTEALLAYAEQNKDKKGFHAKAEELIKSGRSFDSLPDYMNRGIIDTYLYTKSGTMILRNGFFKKYADNPFFGQGSTVEENKNETLDMLGVDFIIHRPGKLPVYVDMKSNSVGNNFISMTLYEDEGEDNTGYHPILLDNPEQEFLTQAYFFQFLYDEDFDRNMPLPEMAENVYTGKYGVKDIKGFASYYVDMKEFNKHILGLCGGKDNLFDESQYWLDQYKVSGAKKAKVYKIPDFPFPLKVSSTSKGYRVQIQIPRHIIRDFCGKFKSPSVVMGNA